MIHRGWVLKNNRRRVRDEKLKALDKGGVTAPAISGDLPRARGQIFVHDGGSRE